jgi:glyoxylase-like metal-dependent hydrolase (beta-lactamase superfamily II)
MIKWYLHGRTDFRKGSFEELEKSIKTRLYSLPDDTLVYTGHGPVTTIRDEKKYNAFVRV